MHLQGSALRSQGGAAAHSQTEMQRKREAQCECLSTNGKPPPGAVDASATPGKSHDEMAVHGVGRRLSLSHCRSRSYRRGPEEHLFATSPEYHSLDARVHPPAVLTRKLLRTHNRLNTISGLLPHPFLFLLFSAPFVLHLLIRALDHFGCSSDTQARFSPARSTTLIHITAVDFAPRPFRPPVSDPSPPLDLYQKPSPDTRLRPNLGVTAACRPCLDSSPGANARLIT